MSQEENNKESWITEDFELTKDKIDEGLLDEWNTATEQFQKMWDVNPNLDNDNGKVPEVYKFSQANPYITDPNPLELSSVLFNQGDTNNAILALEANLQKDSQDGNSWRTLGKLHMDNDQDEPAVRCFLNSVNIDPKNLDNLLALGVSCANLLDEVQAMNHLEHWMKHNPKYQNIITDPEIIPEDLVGKNEYYYEMKAMSKKLLAHFEKARALDPKDIELATALAVLYFVAGDLEAGVKIFKEAVQYDPNNYSLWNKIGATLVNLGGSNEEAIEAYNKALQLKPNYVRGIVNLGIAFANNQNYEEAAGYYISALLINAEAKHVWNYLDIAVSLLEKFELIKLVNDRDIESLRKEFNVEIPNKDE